MESRSDSSPASSRRSPPLQQTLRNALDAGGWLYNDLHEIRGCEPPFGASVVTRVDESEHKLLGNIQTIVHGMRDTAHVRDLQAGLLEQANAFRSSACETPQDVRGRKDALVQIAGLLRRSLHAMESPSDTHEIRVHIRWMIRRDMPEVLATEAESFEFPWLEEDFIHRLKQRNCIGMVAEHDERISGFMIYELNKTRIHLLDIAVAGEDRRCGIGTQMVAKLIGKLAMQRRKRITLEVRETNLEAQLFFRDNEFRAVSVLRGFYDDTPEDAYLMHYRYDPHKEKQSAAPSSASIDRLAG